MDELINLALREYLAHRRNPPGCRQYNTVSEFRAINPNCCKITVGETTIDVNGDGITDTADKVNWNDADKGYLVGRIRIRYYCGSDKADLGQMRISQATISSCGFLTEEFSEAVTQFTKALGR